MGVTNKYVTIKHNIDGAPAESDFELRTADLSLVVVHGSKDVIVKNLYVSIDPYQLNRMKKQSASQTAIDAYGVGRVLESDHPEFATDDYVVGLLGWEEYSIVKGGNMLRKIGSTEFPLSFHAGILGLSGLTAYGGFFNVSKPKKGEKVFVSAATGSVGNLVGQFAKLHGCYVVGCAGSRAKVELLKDQLGFDDAFNYKDEIDLKSALMRVRLCQLIWSLNMNRHFPDGIDIYFDNVGGEMLEAAVANMNIFGRVALCGVISEYTDTGRRAAPDMLDVVYKRISINGFLAADHMHSFSDFTSITSDHLRHKRMRALEDISQGLASVPGAFVGIFRGDNVGKKLVQVAQI
ncbi:NADP-dependent alkenal double bond reductase P2 [Acorus gramineus]|uniref:NADP-dependent alkenal double bond reductase P2 n=1 Tax=Acorus gramineus TaxID=55184 RepID=A0AAV9ALT6_ACOGR|nr:NADP-dependent alkenal double bond reductase P2 [Acorus gramineus]